MIYFLSDAHVGSRALPNRQESQAKLIQLLRQMGKDAEAIYMLGDMFDFWYEYIWPDRSKQEYTPLINTLKELTQKGVELHYFTGNHDIWTFGQLARQTGVIIHRQAEEIELYGKRFFLAHGDGLVPNNYLEQLPKEIRKKMRQFMMLRRVFHSPVAQTLFRLVPPALGNAFGYEWARRSRMKDLTNPFPYKGEHEEELVLFAKEQESLGNHHDYYIFGHRHIELDLMLSSHSRVIILGDMFRLWTYAKLTEKGISMIVNS